jgi:hypothetical protein
MYIIYIYDIYIDIYIYIPLLHKIHYYQYFIQVVLYRKLITVLVYTRRSQSVVLMLKSCPVSGSTRLVFSMITYFYTHAFVAGSYLWWFYSLFIVIYLIHVCICTWCWSHARSVGVPGIYMYLYMYTNIYHDIFIHIWHQCWSHVRPVGISGWSPNPYPLNLTLYLECPSCVSFVYFFSVNIYGLPKYLTRQGGIFRCVYVNIYIYICTRFVLVYVSQEATIYGWVDTS